MVGSSEFKNMPNSTLEQKRLEMLRRQLQGKPSAPLSRETINSTTETVGGSYLRGDLLKILFLAGSAIILEFVLKFTFGSRL